MCRVADLEVARRLIEPDNECAWRLADLHLQVIDLVNRKLHRLALVDYSDGEILFCLGLVIILECSGQLNLIEPDLRLFSLFYCKALSNRIELDEWWKRLRVLRFAWITLHQSLVLQAIGTRQFTVSECENAFWIPRSHQRIFDRADCEIFWDALDFNLEIRLAA